MEGKQVPFDDETIALYTDWLRISKAYKLNSGSGGGGGKRVKDNSGEGKGVEANGHGGDKTELEMRILGAIALRGAS